jgi:N-acetylglutamate synthase-like GNAT family acetyltransferase
VTSESVSVRRATVADAAAIASLSAELGYPVEPGHIQTRLRVLLEATDQAVLVATDADHAVVGWIHGAEHLLLEVGSRCEILGLVVSSGHRRSGIGHRLLTAVEAWAHNRGLPEVSVRSNVLRESSHPFYEKHGYRRVKTQHAYRKTVAEHHG